MQTKNSVKGLRNRQNGALFEQIIDKSLEWYEVRGIAKISKTPEAMKPIKPTGRNGQFVACYTKKAQPDYKGVLNNGQAVVFEAKHTDSEKIEYSRVTEEQRAELEAYYKMGAEVFVLVSVGLVNFYRVPWSVWRSMLEMYGRRHMKLYELERYRVPYMGGVIRLLDGIEAKEQ